MCDRVDLESAQSCGLARLSKLDKASAALGLLRYGVVWIRPALVRRVSNFLCFNYVADYNIRLLETIFGY